MILYLRRIFSALMRLISLLLFLALPLGAEDTVQSAPWTFADYERFNSAGFRLHPPVLKVMDRAKLDVGLLNAAIFFVTNTEREKHGLPMFQTSRALTACAYEHSRDMALENFFSHENPNDPSKRTAWQRMEAATSSAPVALDMPSELPGGWRLAGANARLVPQLDLATQDDPMANGDLEAGKGSFSLALGLNSTAGSYLSAVLRYRFRIEGSCVRLIGYDRLQTHRATLDTQDLSVNFLTGGVLHTSGNAQGDTTKQRRARLAANPRRCLPDLDSAVSFAPLGEPR